MTVTSSLNYTVGSNVKGFTFTTGGFFKAEGFSKVFYNIVYTPSVEERSPSPQELFKS